MGGTMLKVEGLKKNYPSFSLDLSLIVNKGEVLGIIGANGAGKTTLFKAILGLIKKDAGEITLFGKRSDELSLKERQDIAITLADSSFSRYLTIKDVGQILKEMYPSFDPVYFDDLLIKFDLSKDKKLATLSSGMQTRFKLICALCHHPKLLILDEPTIGLDVIGRNELLDLLRNHLCNYEDSTILISSHIASDIETLCDRICLIDKGKIILACDTDLVIDNYGIIKATEAQYQTIDKEYIIGVKKENYGYTLLTEQRSYYRENYPDVITDAAGVDDILTIMTKGGRI